MKKAIILITVISICLSLISCRIFENQTETGVNDSSYTFLISGIDDAADNTDVILLLDVDLSNSNISVIQIPRDTYFNHSHMQNKINQYYSSMRNSGRSEYDAMSDFKELLSKNLGVKIDGFMGITLSAFRDIVDALGGINITLPSDTTLVDDSGEVKYRLSKGQNLLDKDMAEYFVRHRKNYVMGDLGRLDAQKLFLSSMFESIVTNTTPTDILNIFLVLKDKLILDIEIDTVTALLSLFLNRGRLTKSFVTLPGEACESTSGLSYYCLNQKGCEEVIAKYLLKVAPFDPELGFLNKNSIKFENIYYDKNMHYVEYNDENIGKMHILSS